MVKRQRLDSVDEPSSVAKIASLALEDRKHWNGIVELLDLVGRSNGIKKLEGVDALCKLFCHFVETKCLSLDSDKSSSVGVWLRDRCNEYTDMVLNHLIKEKDSALRSLAVFSIARLAKSSSSRKLFSRLVQSILTAEEFDTESTVEFAETYIVPYDDLRLSFFRAASKFCRQIADTGSELQKSKVVTKMIAALSQLRSVPTSKEQCKVYVDDIAQWPDSGKIMSLQRKCFQECWMSLLRMPLQQDEFKHILGIMHAQIIPYLVQPQQIMDFLTDSYNLGGIYSILALSGLFEIIQKNNLDYPLFYPKLYALLDDQVLFTRYKGRFIRLLQTFLSSTNLSANLVASFIKRLSLLSIRASPSGIASIVPLIYNLLKRHPTCMVLLQRQPESEFEDTFDSLEPDPNKTNALSSSLWEMGSLNIHYHGSVASIAQILHEQFHRENYNLEDFIDHSYGSMVDAEIKRPIPREVAIEYTASELFA